MSEKPEKTAPEPAIQGVTAVAMAWINLTNLLIDANVIKKDDLAKMLTENAESAEANGHQVERKMFLALKGGLDRE